MDKVQETSGGIRVRTGARPRPARDPRPWRRTRVAANGRMDVDEPTGTGRRARRGRTLAGTGDRDARPCDDGRGRLAGGVGSDGVRFGVHESSD